MTAPGALPHGEVVRYATTLSGRRAWSRHSFSIVCQLAVSQTISKSPDKLPFTETRVPVGTNGTKGAAAELHWCKSPLGVPSRLLLARETSAD